MVPAYGSFDEGEGALIRERWEGGRTASSFALAVACSWCFMAKASIRKGDLKSAAPTMLLRRGEDFVRPKWGQGLEPDSARFRGAYARLKYTYPRDPSPLWRRDQAESVVARVGVVVGVVVVVARRMWKSLKAAGKPSF